LQQEINPPQESDVLELDIAALFSIDMIKPKRKARPTSTIRRDPTIGRRIA